MSAQRTALSDGRWHFQHGPMDVILKVEGEPAAVAAAVSSAWSRFDVLLSELKVLRQLVRPGVPVESSGLLGVTARQMYASCYPFCSVFVTPMAAVAGAVAQELIARCQGEGITRAWANNGGDIALHLAPGESVDVGLFADVSRLALPLQQGSPIDGRFRVSSDMPVRGVATSGWRGRSLSLGMADSVTVLAATAAQADVAATLIANTVNVVHPAIEHLPANQCQDDSDLGERLVTVNVPPLPGSVVAQALANGVATAQTMRDAGLIFAAALVCQGQIRQTASQAQDVAPVRAEPEAVSRVQRLVLA